MVSAVLLLFALIMTFPAFAQPKFVLKFNHVLGAKEPYHQGFTDWAKAVNEKTKGINQYQSIQFNII